MRQRSITYWTPFSTASFTSTTHLTRAFTPRGGSYSVNKSQWIQRSKGVSRATERALSLSDDRLKSNPRDAEALYNRGITEGLRSTYLVIVEHSSGSRPLPDLLAKRQDGLVEY